MADRLTIFYPSRNVGGIQLALVRMAREIAKLPDWRIVVVDFEDGILRSTLAAWQVETEYICWKPELAPVEVGETTLLLSYSHFPDALKALRATSGSRVLLWSLHAQGTLSYFRFGFLYRRLQPPFRALAARVLEPFTWQRIGRFVAELERSHSLVYMDGTNSIYPPTVGYPHVNLLYLPIPVEAKRGVALDWSDRISLGWLGRLSHDKCNTLFAMLELCSHHALAEGIEIDFHIIGDGPAHERLRDFQAPGVRRIFTGALREQALDDYLATNVKIGFAMGTALVEIAMLGIPALVGDYSNDPYPCERLPLRWLIPNEDFSLGEVIGERSRRAEVSIADLVRLCRDQEANRALGRQFRDYAETNHRADNIGEKLGGFLRSARLGFEAAKPMAGVGSRAWGPHLVRWLGCLRAAAGKA